MKKLITLLLALLLCCGISLQISAEDKYIYDGPDVLTPQEESQLEDLFTDVSSSYNLDIFFIYDDSVADSDLFDSASRYLIEHQTSANAIILFLNNNYYVFDYSGSEEDLLRENEDAIWSAFASKENWSEMIQAYGEAAINVLEGEIKEPVVVQPTISVPILNKKVYVYDGGDVLSAQEEEKLEQKLNTLSKETGLDIVAVTTNTLNGLKPMEYADDFYDYNHYSDDGVLFLVSFEDRDYWFSTKGRGIEVITDYGISQLEKKVVPSLSSGDYYDAFSTYGDVIKKYVDQANTSGPVDVNNKIKQITPTHIAVALIGAGIITLIVNGSYKSQLVSVREERAAYRYIDEGGIHLYNNRDYLVDKRVTTTHIQRSSGGGGGGSSTHISSSGSTHGGGGGKF